MTLGVYQVHALDLIVTIPPLKNHRLGSILSKGCENLDGFRNFFIHISGVHKTQVSILYSRPGFMKCWLLFPTERSDDGANDSLDERVVAINWLHRGVGGLQTDAIAFAIETLERRMRIIEQCDDHVSIFR